MQSQFSTVEEALNQLVNGGYIILADNEDRERGKWFDVCTSKRRYC